MSSIARRLPVIALFVSLLLIGPVISYAQSTAATDGATPLGLKPGSPVGSYQLSGFDNVNIYNGNLNFSLPLVTITGRGGTTFPINLRINQKWIIAKELFTDPHPRFYYYPTPNWWDHDTGIQGIYDVGHLSMRQGGSKTFTLRCPSLGYYVHQSTLTRLTFTAPDGTEYELIDQATNGEPNGSDCSTGGFNRGKTFVTADGTSATFISNTDIHDYLADNPGNYVPEGYLMLRDGSRYHIVANSGDVDWMTDRNGNKFTFSHDIYGRLTSVKDSLNREVTITYGAGGGAYTEIIAKGFGGASRSTKIYYATVSTDLRSGFTAQTQAALFPEVDGSLYANPIGVVSAVELPNGKQYEFKYNPYGELARVVLPTGGAIEYDYAQGLTNSGSSGVFSVSGDYYCYRRVTERRVYDAGGTGASYTSKTTYSRPETTTSNAGYVTVDQLDSTNTLVNRQIHYFYGSPRDSFSIDPAHYPAYLDGREYKTEFYDSNGSTLLKKIETNFEQRAAVSWWTGSAADAPPNDVRSTETITTLRETVSPFTEHVSKQVFGYDDSVPFNNRNSVKEYDFGNGSPGSLIRETQTTYVTSSTYTGNTVHILNLPSQVSVFKSGSPNVEKTRTTFEYDNYTAGSGIDCVITLDFHCPLVARSSVSGFDTSFSTSYTTRGNLTAPTQYFLSGGTVTGSVSSYSHYDVLGNVVRAIDPRSTTGHFIATTFDYDDRFGTPNGNARLNPGPTDLSSGTITYAFPTKIINALGHTSYTQFDYYLGKPVDGEDANGNVASGFYNDSLDRPKKVQRAVGTTLQNQTTFNYDDTAREITTTSDRDIDTDGLLVSKLIYDQMGRTTETRQYENSSNYIAVKTEYDDLGRTYKTSNPYRPWQSESALWTTLEFDALGRVKHATTPNSAVISTSYPGNAVIVTDQTGKERKSVTDGLGRLIQIYEDPGTGTHFNYLTTYEYDVLDDLIKVIQDNTPSSPVQPAREFNYDSLKRLTSAKNPESGTVNYQYDNAGNLTQKTDARGVVTTYGYDALSRNTSVAYSSDPAGTLPVTRVYDSATNGVGKLYQSYTTGAGASKSTIPAYDELGRPSSISQQFYGTTWGTSYTTTRSYNLAGGVTGQTYSSSRTVSYTYDDAGRVSGFTGYLGDDTNRDYATEILYSPFGGSTKEKFGTSTAVYDKRFYNSRGQLSEIREGTTWTGASDTGWNRGAIINHYSDSCWGMCGGNNSTTAMPYNNGNLLKQEIYIPGDDSITSYNMRWQDYHYDSLNRLDWSREVYNDTEQWKQGYHYDRYGNRTIDSGVTFGSINNTVFTVDQLTNRLDKPTGQTGPMTYDDAGNLTVNSYGEFRQGTYDAENHMVAAKDSAANWSYYTYNADGQRVRRKINNVETWQIYGLDGEVVAEYPANGPATDPQKEYGYRNGQLLVTAEPAAVTSGTQNVTWINTASVVVSSNSLTKNTTDGWGNSGGASQQSFSGDGYVEFTASEDNDYRMIGLSHGDSNQDYTDIDFAVYLAGGGTGTLCIYEAGVGHGCPGSFTTGDVIRIGVESGVVVYKKNGTTFYTSSVSPTYPLNADAALYSNTSTINNVKISGALTTGGPGTVHWLVADQLGTPRMILDQSGSLANVKRHDYLPFGEEVASSISGRSGYGYGGGDGARQQFTQKERDIETDLDYFLARYHSSDQGRFISPDTFGGSGFVSVPQSWNKYTYCLNRPFVFTDPSGQIWLTTDNQNFIWIEDDDYEKNQKQYKDYSVANGAVINYRTSMNCPQCANVSPGQWLQLNADGTITGVPNPTTYIYAEYSDDEISHPFPVVGTGTVIFKELEGGPKNGNINFHNKGGGHTERWYDNNGRAWVDIDYGHDHGAGDPHVHWWDWTGIWPDRSEGQPVPEGWDLFQWDDGSTGVNPNRRRQSPSPLGIPMTPMDAPIGVPIRPVVPLRPTVPLRPVLVP